MMYFQLWDIVSGDLLCCFVFDVGILSATMNLTETQLFAGGANGTIYTVSLYETVSYSSGTCY